MLGTIDRAHAARLLQALASADAAAVLAEVSQLDEMVPDYVAALDELALLIQQVALAQVAGEAIDAAVVDPAQVHELAQAISAEDLQLFYQIALIGKRDLNLAPSLRTGFEMVLLRMLTFRPAEAAPLPRQGPAPARAASAAAPAVSGKGSGAADAATTVPVASAADPTDPGSPDVDWVELVANLDLGGAARQLASHCMFTSRQGRVVELTLEQGQSHLRTDALQEKLRKALCKHFAEDLRLQISLGRPQAETPAQRRQRQALELQREAVATIKGDPNVLAMEQAFGATLDEDSIKPVKH